MTTSLRAGDLVLADLNPVIGREQGGRRPVLVVSHTRYAMIPGLFLGVPLTSTDRGLPHHIEVEADPGTGLERISFAMTEQVRVLSSRRALRGLGRIGQPARDRVSSYLHLFIA